MSDGVRVRKDVPSGTIIIDRPGRRNALDLRTLADLQQALDDFHGEKKVRGVILTHQGPAFSAGTDLKELREMQEQNDAWESYQEYVEALQSLLESMLRYPKPLIAAIDGWCVGTGVALIAACDVVLASPASRFWLPEPLRGLSASISAPLLAFRQGVAVAQQMLMAHEPVTAQQAGDWALVNELVPSELLWARSQQRVITWAQGAPHSWLLARQMLNETVGEALFTQLAIGASQMATARTTDNAREGTLAFLEKRTAQFL